MPPKGDSLRAAAALVPRLAALVELAAALAEADPARAAAVRASAESAYAAHGLVPDAWRAPSAADAIAGAREALGPDAAVAASERGRAMSVDDAVRLALG